MSQEDYRFTPEQAASAVNLAIFRLEAGIEPSWTAVCVCGNACGMALLEPSADDRHYVACPSCESTGRDGSIHWERD